MFRSVRDKDVIMRLGYPKVTPLISSGDFENGNLMAATWHTHLSGIPPLYGVSIAPDRYTYKLIKETGEFGVNFLPFRLYELVWKCGLVSGANVDKFEKFKIRKMRGKVIKAPLVEESIVILECKVTKDVKVGDHVFFVGEIVHAWVRDNLLLSKGILDITGDKHVYYLGRGNFCTIDKNTVKSLKN